MNSVCRCVPLRGLDILIYIQYMIYDDNIYYNVKHRVLVQTFEPWLPTLRSHHPTAPIWSRKAKKETPSASKNQTYGGFHKCGYPKQGLLLVEVPIAINRWFKRYPYFRKPPLAQMVRQLSMSCDRLAHLIWIWARPPLQPWFINFFWCQAHEKACRTASVWALWARAVECRTSL